MAAAVPYLIVGAIGLVGQWLLGPKSKAQDNAASPFPQVNQALRGTPVFVTFGTCRVSAQVTWTKNWTATRQKGGGKGAAKGGGSGGGGAAKGGGASGQGYNYSWDMIFNFGIVDVPVVATKAWIGSDRVTPATVEAWNTDFVAPTQLYKLLLGNANAELQANETFLAPGYNTGDPLLTTWPYYTTQEGTAQAWPSTCWLGFNQLQLGTTPAIPQLSLELTPTTSTGFTPVPTYDRHLNATDLSTTFAGKDGNNYTHMYTGSDRWEVIYGFGGVLSSTQTYFYNIDQNVSITITDAAFLAYGTSLGFDMSLYNFECVWPVPGTDRFVAAFNRNGGTGDLVIFILFKLNTDNTTVSIVSYQQGHHGTYWYWPQQHKGIFYDPSTGNLSIAANLTGTHQYFCIYTLNIDGFAGQTNIDYDPHIQPIYEALNELNVFYWGASTHQSWCAVRDNSGVYVYFPKAQVALMASHPGDNPLHDAVVALGATTGHFVFIGPSLSAITITNLDGVYDLADGGKHLDGSPSASENDDYNSPNLILLEDGTTAFVFCRSYSVSADRGGVNGTYSRIKIFKLDGTKLADFSTQLFDQSLLPTQDNPPIDIQIGRNPVTGTFQYQWFSTLDYVWGDAFEFNTTAVDVTPPYIIKRILTSPVFGFATQSLFGFSITTASIDDATYQDAVAKCVAENVYISVNYTNQDGVLTIINDLLALYGGTLAEQGGKIYFDVFRADDVPLRTLDNDHLIRTADGAAPVNVTKGAVQDGYNTVQYQFYDRSLDYKQNQVTLSDEVDIDLNGTRNKSYPSKYVMTGSLAMQVAERALWSNMYGRDNYDFKVGWKDADLRPGLQVTLVDSFHPALQKGVRMVINNIKEETRGVFSVTGTRVYANHLTAQHGYTATFSISDGPASLVYPATPMQYTNAYELPAEFQGSNAFMFFGYAMASPLMGAQLYVSHDLGANYALVQDVQPYAISGRLGVDLVQRPPGYMEQGIDLKVFTNSGFNVNTPEFVVPYTFDDATPSVRASGASVIIVGSEAMAMEGLTLLGQNHYRVEKLYRGWGGTPINAQNSGSYFTENAAGIFALPITQDDIGTTIFYKVAGYNFAGHVYDISSIPAQSYIVKGLKWLPREQSHSRIFVQSGVSWSANTPFNGDHLSVTSGGCAVSLHFPAGSNTDGFGAGGFGAGGFGHFAGDVTTPTYRIEVQSSNGATVNSTVVYTGNYTYTLAQNSADFNGFAKDLCFKVTPFNVKGDGPVSDVRTIQLFW